MITTTVLETELNSSRTQTAVSGPGVPLSRKGRSCYSDQRRYCTLKQVNCIMKPFYICTILVLLICTSAFEPTFAKLTAHQERHLREVAKQFPDAETHLEAFIQNLDGIRGWVQKDVLATTAVGKSTEACELCKTLIGLALSILRGGGGLDLIKDFLKTICIAVTNPAFNEVCNGAVDIYGGPLEYILTKRTDVTVTAHDLCGIYTGTVGGCDPINPLLTNWTINVNQTKPALQTPPPLPDNTPEVKILHLTDIHPDRFYEVGSDKDCGKPLCCRGAVHPNESYRAGPHGDDLCDMPISAMEELFQNAKGRFEYSFVLMTGDLVHHAIWATSKYDNLLHYGLVNTPLVELFDTTPIYPVIGNHEPHPCNMFPPESVWGVSEEYNVSWVYNTIADSYVKWLDPSAQVTFRRAGYYTLKIPSNGPRLVAINTNFCYINNFWLFFDSRDPGGQLQWLADTLQAAETAGEVVYIAGHIPPGKGDCWNVWSAKFNEIIIRYEGIIKAQFYGHTHNDETTIFFDKSSDPPRPANTLNIGVSTTSYTHLNPGYKVFYADGGRADATWEMIDHETWIYNLTAANLAGASVLPDWYQLYSMKRAFNLPSLRPTDLYDLVVKMVTDDALFQKYYEHYHKGYHLRERCDIFRCKMDFLCDIVKADSGDFSHCVRLFEIADGTTTTEGGGGTTTTEGGGGTTTTGSETTTSFALPIVQNNVVTLVVAFLATLLLQH